METVPPKVWLITDTHFNHARMLELCGRPVNFNELIIENWRRVVGSDDLVFHLGDVIFNRAGELKSIMAGLPGTKIMVKGNHDHAPSRWYMRRGFAFCCYGFEFRGCYFTHKPAKALPEGCKVNIHGHLHNSRHHDGEFAPQPWHRLLAIENEGYSPVLLDSFLARG